MIRPIATLAAAVLALGACGGQAQVNPPGYIVDILRQPNGDRRSDARFEMDDAACIITAQRTYRDAALMTVVARVPPIIGVFDNVPNRQAENTLVNCMLSKGWRKVATQAEADQLAAEARADRKAGR